MGHHTAKSAYKNLEERINWFTQGAPESESLYKILQVLFTEKEAQLVSRLPIRPFTLKKAAKLWNTTELKAEKFLDHLCEKGLLVDSYYSGERRFVLPPPMIGFFEFALMRTRGDIDQKYLSELFYQYLDVEEDFIKELFFILLKSNFVIISRFLLVYNKTMNNVITSTKKIINIICELIAQQSFLTGIKL